MERQGMGVERRPEERIAGERNGLLRILRTGILLISKWNGGERIGQDRRGEHRIGLERIGGERNGSDLSPQTF